MATLAQKQAAFAAYQVGIMTDAELDICRHAIRDLNETMRAVGEHGYCMLGWFQLYDSLEQMHDARDRDAKARSSKGNRP
jgi:hypothetical protein